MRPFQKIIIDQIDNIRRWRDKRLITSKEELLLIYAVHLLTKRLRRHYRREQNTTKQN